MNPSTGRPWCIEDIRKPSCKSGFSHVAKIAGPSRGTSKVYYQARIDRAAEDRAGSDSLWRGTGRPTPEEAAQDYCDYLNGLPAGAYSDETSGPYAGSRLLTALNRTRGDADDWGADGEHERRATMVKPRHREQLIASGHAGEAVEFKPTGITSAEYFAMLGKALAQRVVGIEPDPFMLSDPYDEVVAQSARVLRVDVVWLDGSDMTEDGFLHEHY